MGAKGISNGIEQLLTKQKAVEKQSVQLTRQWKDIRNRIDSLLLSMDRLKTAEVRQKCQALDQMGTEEREAYVGQHWGEVALQKVRPFLQQLATLEEALLKSG